MRMQVYLIRQAVGAICEVVLRDLDVDRFRTFDVRELTVIRASKQKASSCPREQPQNARFDLVVRR